MHKSNSTQSPIKQLGLYDATMLVAGSMIGSGIFIVSADITRNVGSGFWLIAVWVLTAILTIAAALSYGELSAMFPNAGGQYVYLQKAFGNRMAFLYGWTLFAVIQTGTIAAVGVAFAKFAAYFFPIFELNHTHVLFNTPISAVEPAHILSISIIILLTAINANSINSGKWIQTLFTTSKIAALLLLIVIGLGLGFNKQVWHDNYSMGTAMYAIPGGGLAPYAKVGIATIMGAIAAAMVGSVFSADAWNNITFIAGEVKNPQRNIGLSLLLGTGMVLLLYILTNVMYTGVLSLPEIASAKSDRVAVAVCEKIFGSNGTKLMALLIMISTFGCVNGMILSGARVYYTMAKDKLFFKQAAILNSKQIPANALWLQAIWAGLLCLSGKYGDLLDYVVIAVLIFYIITIAALFHLRRTAPQLPRPYKVIGYPWVPSIYIIMASCLGLLLLYYKPTFTRNGILIVLLGVPVYYLIQFFGNKNNAAKQ
jgi:basic amino acid/polyamine antiporter, APA family